MMRRLVFICLLLSIVVAGRQAQAQSVLSSDEIVQSLKALDATPVVIDVQALRRQAADNIRQHRGTNPATREPLSEQLSKLRQFDIEILFDFNSAVIRPDSYRAVGLIADALNHPYLLEYRFLIAGHTDAKGGREFNLELSQKRADAIREALTTTFRIPKIRLVSVGLGEEQLRDRAAPQSGINRRVQIINIGKAR